jgi:aryl-alcohol dehydrogenase-like predicted oxidoreductase
VALAKVALSELPLIMRVKGENERLLGEVIKEESAKDPSYRSKLFLCTKFGSYWDPPSFNPGDHVRILQRSDPAYIRQQCEASLKNLGVDYIDLYYQNRMVKDAETSVEDTWKTVVELQKEGKIKYLGLSEADEEYIRRVSKVAKIDALQVEVNTNFRDSYSCINDLLQFSPFTPNIKTNGILAACRELGISIVCYSPLGRGRHSVTVLAPFVLKPMIFLRSINGQDRRQHHV